MATVAPCPVVIKVPLKGTRSRAPPVAARLAAWSPTREAKATSPEAVARKELIRASELARKAAIAAAHNERVANKVAGAAELRAQTIYYLSSTIDRRLQKSEARRSDNLSAVKAKAFNVSARVQQVAEKNQERKVVLATNLDRSLEHAHEKRQQRIRNIQFKASLTTQKQKAAKAQAAQQVAELSQRIAESLQTAAEKRAVHLSARATKAAHFNAGAAAGVQRARQVAETEAREKAANLDSRLQAADFLHSLALRLRQSKAAIANEHHASVVQRQRLTDTVSPMLKAAKLKATLYIAGELREAALEQVATKASRTVRRMVATVARKEVEERERQEAARVNLEHKLAAAAARKEERHLGSPRNVKSVNVNLRRSESPDFGKTRSDPTGHSSAPCSPVGGLPAGAC